MPRSIHVLAENEIVRSQQTPANARRCRFNVGLQSAISARHYLNIRIRTVWCARSSRVVQGHKAPFSGYVAACTITPCLVLPQHCTRDIDPMLNQCWASVYDASPTLNHHWVNFPCLVGGGGRTSVPFVSTLFLFVYHGGPTTPSLLLITL